MNQPTFNDVEKVIKYLSSNSIIVQEVTLLGSVDNNWYLNILSDNEIYNVELNGLMPKVLVKENGEFVMLE